MTPSEKIANYRKEAKTWIKERQYHAGIVFDLCDELESMLATSLRMDTVIHDASKDCEAADRSVKATIARIDEVLDINHDAD